MFLGAVIAESDCTQIYTQYQKTLELFAKYVVANSYEMGIGHTDPSVTYLSDRHVLRMVMKLYGLSTEGIDFKTSAHDLEYSAKIAPTIFKYNLHCKAGNNDACKVAVTDSFVNHLTFLTNYIANVDARLNQNPQYTVSQTLEYLGYIASSGVEDHYENHLYLGAYWKLTGQSTDVVSLYLLVGFPDETNETNAVYQWGCSDFIWQRTPYEECSGASRDYTGIDFLIAYALTR
ncbi:MAG: hypothetical protein HQM11_07600 [SAR324 cluster bacterium]|nr:hypothetical protein [SAR324 cluster bacterium]